MSYVPLLQPRWVVIGTYRNLPLPLRPIPPYTKPTKWPPAYLSRSKQAPIDINTDADAAATAAAVNPNSPPDGRAR